MKVLCIADCHDGKWLYIHGQEYEIDPKNPDEMKNSCIVHMQAGAGASPEDIATLQKAQRAEIARGRAERENKRAAKPEDGTDDFADMALPMPDQG